jgi:putative hemolysin
VTGRSATTPGRARLPESLNAVAALRELQTTRQQLALVVSEHGGIEGIITVEDLVEELVGEIYDEHDRDIQAVIHEPDGSLTVPGWFPLHDLEDLGLDATGDDATTVGGLVVERLGRLPVTGDTVTIGGAHYAVLAVRRRAVERVRILVDVDEADGGVGTTQDGAIE